MTWNRMLFLFVLYVSAIYRKPMRVKSLVVCWTRDCGLREATRNAL